MSDTGDLLNSIITLAVTGATFYFFHTTVVMPVMSGSEPEFEQAASEVAQTGTAILETVFVVFLTLIAISLIPFLIGALGGAAKLVSNQKAYPIKAFGPRRETDTEPAGASVEYDSKRCLNCSKPLNEDDCYRNIAEEWNVIAGFKVTRNHRLETFECAECNQANWFDYAMRAGEHDSDLLDPEAIESESKLESVDSDSESNDTPGKEKLDCPVCGNGPFRGEQGLNIHRTKMHGGEEESEEKEQTEP